MLFPHQRVKTMNGLDPSFASVNAIAREVRLVSPQRPDPLGSHELDWEYEGRYLELERRLFDQAGHNSVQRARRIRNGSRPVRKAERDDSETPWPLAAQVLSQLPAHEQNYRYRYPRTGSQQAQQL